ncbi:thiamine pyrophosphate-dependent enzyme [Tichowtungia aerotolerans]|uniref:Indolepyruvate oxidoreductase subunit IorA n=1 Tax=Tichowtungia aerotolerans TaxID=2697043 RepID=A0A6P1MHN2_9BACT|nr:thiamine pyrophosphate-dependent enzyme [Tichowtungia aerotolerans]QHI70575.1 thiamine pyrophosphate-binding protein [Tichowtungia aerotolerans]
MSKERMLLSGNEAVALGALHAGTTLGVGYPGTPSTEILENASKLGVNCQWSPNEKVASEVAIGVAFAGARTLCTMKHVGLNVAADPFFTVAYTGVTGGMVLAVADDPGMASSQNEQDSRNYARAAGVPMLEPADSQEAYEMTRLAFELSERWKQPVILRLCTRVCHSKTIVVPCEATEGPGADYQRDIKQRVMIPAYARLAHKTLRKKLADLEEWNCASGPNQVLGEGRLGIIANGVAALHAQEAVPEARIFKIGMSWPLPMKALLEFIASVDDCVVIEEGDPFIQTEIQAAGGKVRPRLERYRFGELDVTRVKRILAGDDSEEAAPPKGKPPQLCQGCPHRFSFEVLKKRGCIITGDIGCYTLSVLPPFETMDTCVCMGASIGVGLGMRHVLPEDQARKVVSVIGDSTFMHSGLTGIAEMIYNRPKTGHVIVILDNSTTAMTGLQEHPGTGKKMDHSAAENRVCIEDTLKAMGVEKIVIVDPSKEAGAYEKAVDEALGSNDLTVIIARRPCILALARDAKFARGEKVR